MACLFGSVLTAMAMTLILPFLPLYIKNLGISDPTEIVQWSGISFSATYITGGIVAPLWGHLGNRFGRKVMLIRASLGMAICMTLMGLVSQAWELVALRLIMGLAGGYSSGSMILVAMQTPKERAAQVLGFLSAGIMAGNLLGPLMGGLLPAIMDLRAIYWSAGALIFLAFLSTALFVKEASTLDPHKSAKMGRWADIRKPNLVTAMLLSSLVLMMANMSIEPILTVYVSGLVANPAHATAVAGLVMSAAALGSIVSSFQLGKLADKVGYRPIIIWALVLAALLLIPQAFVTQSWQLIVLRFLMGLALGGLLPCISAVIRYNVSDNFTGIVLGYSISCQFAGQFLGPFLGGFVGGHMGISWVFLLTSLIMAMSAYVVHRSH